MSHNIMQLLKLVYITFMILILYFRPFYCLFIVLLFYAEYFYFVSFLSDIYNNYDKYYRLEVVEVDLSNMKSIDIWIEYCKLQAFQKVYLLFAKKKIRVFNIFLTFFILIFSIPFKFLKLCYYFIVKNESSFKLGLEFLYFNRYLLIKNLKIEVFDRKIYLNCFTIGKFTRKLLSMNSSITEKKFIEGIKAFREQAEEFRKFENQEEFKERIQLISGRDRDDKTIYSPHYGYIEGNNTIHSTSNVSFSLERNQVLDVPMPSLIKINALNPGTVISKEIFKIIKLPKFIIIPKEELNSIKYSHTDIFSLNKEVYKYNLNKDLTYQSIMKEYFNIEKNVDNSLLRELRANNYTFFLIHAKNKDIELAYDNFYKNINS